MRILFVSSHPFDYNRVLVLLQGLKRRDDHYIETYIIQSKYKFNSRKFRDLCAGFDFIYIPPFRHNDVRFVKKRVDTPIIFDPLISKYLTSTDDHGKPWKGPKKYLIDYLALRNADHILCDTEAHKAYFSSTFCIPKSRISTLPVGVDTSLFCPAQVEKANEKFVVGFYGTFVPLQAVPKIIDCAEKLKKDHPDIEFIIIGNGKARAKMEQDAINRGLSNIIFSGFLDYNELPQSMQNFDLCLGIFGDSLKANLVVPNKVYHYAALAKCFITADTKGIREVFTHNENAILCKPEVDSICQAIVDIKNQPKHRASIGRAARNLMVKKYNEDQIADRFITILEDIKIE